MSDMEIIARNWRELIRPKGITVDEASATFGRFVAEPFERGFGITIGNSCDAFFYRHCKALRSLQCIDGVLQNL